MHRNRQEIQSENSRRQELIERLNKNRFETVDDSPAPVSTRSRTPPHVASDFDQVYKLVILFMNFKPELSTLLKLKIVAFDIEDIWLTLKLHTEFYLTTAYCFL